jgi:uncharacterized protein (UPF0218 family)
MVGYQVEGGMDISKSKGQQVHREHVTDNKRSVGERAAHTNNKAGQLTDSSYSTVSYR